MSAFDELRSLVDALELPPGAFSGVTALDNRVVAALVALGLSGATITLKTNGVNNGSQTILNLKNGSNVTITDDGVGGVTVNATGGSPGGAVNTIQYNNTGVLGGVALNATATKMYLQQVSSAVASFAQVLDSDLGLSDILTNNVSITAHGFAPKLPNDGTVFLDGLGNYSAPVSASNALDFYQQAALGAIIGSTVAAGNFTVGFQIYCTRALTVTGIKFFWNGGVGAKTVKCQIWNRGNSNASSSILGTANVNVNAQQLYTATFGSPLLLTVGKYYSVGTYETGGGFNVQYIPPFIATSTQRIFTGLFWTQNFLTFASGDADPTNNDGNYHPIQIEATLT